MPKSPEDPDDTRSESDHRVPSCWMEDTDVEDTEFEYSTRHPDDWVISGPLGVYGKGPGRCFAIWSHAERWARGFYGARYKGKILEAATDGGNRWAFLIRGPRGSK